MLASLDVKLSVGWSIGQPVTQSVGQSVSRSDHDDYNDHDDHVSSTHKIILIILIMTMHILSDDKTFSLKMLSDRIQSPSYVSTVPDGPNLLKLHLATCYNHTVWEKVTMIIKCKRIFRGIISLQKNFHTFGKTSLRGSFLCSGSRFDIFKT